MHQSINLNNTVDCKALTDEGLLSTVFERLNMCLVLQPNDRNYHFSVESFPTLTVATKPLPKGKVYCMRRHNHQNKEPKKTKKQSECIQNKPLI